MHRHYRHISPRTTAMSLLSGKQFFLSNANITHRVDFVGGGDDGRVKKDGEELDPHVHVEK